MIDPTALVDLAPHLADAAMLSANARVRAAVEMVIEVYPAESRGAYETVRSADGTVLRLAHTAYCCNGVKLEGFPADGWCASVERAESMLGAAIIAAGLLAPDGSRLMWRVAPEIFFHPDRRRRRRPFNGYARFTLVPAGFELVLADTARNPAAAALLN